ncbi:hypothetical protein [Heliomicrobium modesticaldum]|nr:hypothetical protein [Heliomicrobium modesticaldum]
MRLVPAGIVDEFYLEKLGRIDFQNILHNPFGDRLRKMLEELERSSRLDFIFLDCRAGFHDIGGLAMADLAHAAVVLGSHSRQTWAGLTQVIRRLARPLASEQEALPIVLAHAMAPSLMSPGSEPELRAFREMAYTVFLENYYSDSEDHPAPNERDEDAPSTPVVIPWNSELRGDIMLFSTSDSLEEKRRLEALIATLTALPYQQLAERICLLFGRNLQGERG